jgi:ubiquitin-protein ligase
MKRIMRDMELLRAAAGQDGQVQAEFIGDDFTRIRMTIKTPADRVYAGAVHELEMSLQYKDYHGSRVYPRHPPRVVFRTPIFHPNIGEFCRATGEAAICLDILKDDSKWSPLNTLATVGQSILLLLDNPNSLSPLNPTAARLWDRCVAAFESTGCDEQQRKRCFLPYEEAARATR